MRKLLVFFVFLSIVCILVIKYFWANTPEWWEYGEETGDVLFDLSVGYISAFIFYLIDIWIPEIKEKNKINERLAVPLSRLLNHIKTPIMSIHNKYAQEKKDFYNLSKDEFIETIKKVDLINDYSESYFIDIKRYATYGEYLDYEISRVNEYIEEIYKVPLKLDLTLIEILDDIKKSEYHQIMESTKRIGGFYNHNITMQGTVIAESFYKYYLLFIKLKEYMLKNKIPITIKDL
ncbi:hypothetical protein NSR00_17795 [Aeribacillus sp. FSL K6-8394]|uniref:hypothetical protein n=1 Tax=Aeribacillus sp. FSL K6-8394 TaxID=2954570 RepID=UPI0030F5441A